MNTRLLNWLKENTGRHMDSPRKNVFGRNPQGFTIKHVDEAKKLIRISFGKKRILALPLHFWMFERTMKYLSESPRTAYPIGARLQPPYPKESIEGEIWKDPKPYPSEYKTAPHVLDILTIAGFTEFAYTKDRDTKRKVQGAKYVSSEQPQKKVIIPTFSTTSDKEKFLEKYGKAIRKWVMDHKEEIIKNRLNYRWKNLTRKQCEKLRNQINTMIIQSRIKNRGAIDIDTLDEIIRWGFGMKYPDQNPERAQQLSRKAFNYLDNGKITDATKTLLNVKGLGISRVTKILGLSDQENLCIYDSRVGYAFRDLTFNGKRIHLIPASRTSGERSKECDLNISNEEWATEYERILWTIELIKDCMNELGCTYRQADVEMALFMMGQ